MERTMSDELTKLDATNIRNRIFTIRNVQVMLDSDLARIYEVETRIFNQAVKRNIARFPERFRFLLTNAELTNLRSQIVTSSDNSEFSLRSQFVTLKTGGGRGQHRKYLPYVFTEQGVAMLSAVLRSKAAVEVSIKIIDAFVEMRRFIQNNAVLFARMESMERRQLSFEIKTDENFEKIFNALSQSSDIPRQGIFYNGQVFDAHVFTSKLIRKAKSSLILVDNYIDESILDLFTKRKRSVSATIYTRRITKTLALDIQKHNEQHPPVKVELFKDAHDRFLIIDKKEIYHIGASLKDLGKKWFAFSKFDTGAVDMLDKLHGVKNR